MVVLNGRLLGMVGILKEESMRLLILGASMIVKYSLVAVHIITGPINAWGQVFFVRSIEQAMIIKIHM